MDMTDERQKDLPESSEERCDIKVWCDACKRSEYTTSTDKYLCATCGKIMVLDHEMHHEHFPHLSGDKDMLH
jgi:hypothetical protein